MKRINIYIVIILFLAVTNIATIVSSARINSKTSEQSEIPVVEMQRESRMGFFGTEIGLDENQTEEFIGHNRSYNTKAGNITDDLTALRHRMIEEMVSSDQDSVRLERILEEFGDYHVQLKRATIEYYNNLNSICDARQQARLQFLFNDMLDPDGMIYGRGRGGQGRGRALGPRDGRRRGGGRGYGRTDSITINSKQLNF